MPVLPEPAYHVVFPFTSGHVQTLYPPLFRSVPAIAVQRERVHTADGDFLDMDVACAGACPSDHVVILSHGLEGHSRRKYIRGLAKACLQQKWDVIAWNFRGCSEEINNAPRMYHSGETDDLHAVVMACIQKGYSSIALVGVSMGANQICKYLGEAPERVPAEVGAAVAFSVPCDLTGASEELAKRENTLYMQYFLRSLRRKVHMKHAQFPELYPLEGLETMQTFAEFDGAYTAPVNGFSSAQDYWERCGCGQFLDDVALPCLIVNAQDDPFLSPSCYPVEQAAASCHVFLEMPKHGGHVGFVQHNTEGMYWSEKRAVQFLQHYLLQQ